VGAGVSVVLAVFTDGRDDLLARTLDSAAENLHGDITRGIVFDDTGDPDHAEKLHRQLKPNWTVRGAMSRRGFGGNIRAAWAHLATLPERWVFHLEDDFTLNRPVHLAHLTRVLDERPYLAQMALLRQPWNPQEQAAGGIVEQHPDDYVEVVDGTTAAWLEHRRFFTTNPCLYRRELCERGWPEVDQSEGHFSIDLFSDPAVRCGFWGRRTDTPAVHHIGRDRVGVGY
jgi:hypothetical protein